MSALSPATAEREGFADQIQHGKRNDVVRRERGGEHADQADEADDYAH